MAEIFKCFLMDVNGYYGDPVLVEATGEKTMEFVKKFITTNHEIRVVDSDDFIVFHVVDQTLVFPIPEYGSPKNKWNPETSKFQNQ